MNAVTSKAEAHKTARTYFDRILQNIQDRRIAPWKGATVGEPVLVRDETSSPLFWLVPYERQGKVIGYIRVGTDGGIMEHGYFYTDPEDLNPCPPVVTRMTSREALDHAGKLLEEYREYDVEPPVYVYDRLRDTLAWMIEIRHAGAVINRIFVSPGYIYKRKPDEKAPPPGMRGRKD